MQRILRLSIRLLMGCLALGYLPPIQAAEFCADNYYINVTLPNQARWDMCWEHRAREGILLHHVFYTPRGGARQMVFYQAALAQIHVPYDDNGARYHDVSDYGLGNSYMMNLSTQDCPNGELLSYAGKNVLCKQVGARDDAYSDNSDRLQGDALSLFSMSSIGAYNYVPQWRFLDDGSIEPGIGATGALQRFGTGGLERQGWLIENNKVGIAHLHNFFWKLDFDLGNTGNDDIVEEFNYTQAGGKTTRAVTRFTTETARNVEPTSLRTWRILDGNLKNTKGLPISYDIRLNQANQMDTGPSAEPFTHFDFYVTKQKSCELFASHNPTTNGCADNLSTFANNESISGQDIVVWPSVTFYHMPRAEDAPYMDAHWSSFRITPRDWHSVNPLSNSAETTGTTNPEPPTPPSTDTYSNSAAGLTVNGLLNDWASLTPFPADPDDISGAANKLDWLQAWMANDNSNLYIAYKTQDAIPEHNWAYQAYLDVDNNTATGYPSSNVMGADYLIEGRSVWRYIGTNGSWNWIYQGEATSAVNANTLEIRIARSLLGNPSQLRVIFWGSNAAFGGTATDAYPDGITNANAAVRYFNYRMYTSGVTPPPPTDPRINNTVTSMAVDGNLADWTGKTSFGIDPNEMSGANLIDWQEGWMANSSSTVYLAYRTKNTVNIQNVWGHNIYLDTDENPATGYRQDGLGAEYLIEGTTLWRYTGTGGDNWNWTEVAYGIRRTGDTTAEFSFPRSSIGNPSALRLSFVGVNAAIGGNAVDNYPDTNRTPNYFSYRF